MNRTPGLWVAGATISLIAHGALFTFLLFSVDPEPVDPQPLPQSQLDIAAYEVERTQASETQAQGEKAKPSQAAGAAAVQGAIPVSKASQTQLNSETAKQATLANVASAVVALQSSSKPISNVSPTSAVLHPSRSNAPQLVALSMPDEITTKPFAIAELASLVTPAKSTSQSIDEVTPPSPTVGATESNAPLMVAARPEAAALSQIEASLENLDDIAATTEPLAQKPTDQLANPLPSSTLPAEFATAALAWSGNETGESVDPVSIAAIQAFLRPGDLTNANGNGENVRDGISTLLAGVPCARLQAAFIPETGALELRGHVPEDGLRRPVLAALQSQIGLDIPVIDNMLILPRPQCGALSGISTVGLPQSTDQLTNPLLVGANAHAREYNYAEGERLTFDLTAPEYNAFVYVDYFDADGMVIHLVPNEIVPLENQTADAIVTVGVERDDLPSLNITIGPPFGQEIAVAFASSAQLYEGLRPITEPAEEYLEFLKERVADARANHVDFKGEWVYFFISTAPQTQ